MRPSDPPSSKPGELPITYTAATEPCRAEIAAVRELALPAWIAAMAEVDWLIEAQLLAEGR